jgi:hypothetical protein
MPANGCLGALAGMPWSHSNYVLPLCSHLQISHDFKVYLLCHRGHTSRIALQSWQFYHACKWVPACTGRITLKSWQLCFACELLPGSYLQISHDFKSFLLCHGGVPRADKQNHLEVRVILLCLQIAAWVHWQKCIEVMHYLQAILYSH